MTAAVAPLAERVAFHTWLHLLLDQQLAAANAGDVRLIQDLAIGADPDGADTWQLQDLLALDVSIGAPPTTSRRTGSSGACPRSSPGGFATPATARWPSCCGRRWRRAAGSRRPRDGAGPPLLGPAGRRRPTAAYVRFAGRELLEVLALESERAGALVVGEDLGTVEDHFRDELQPPGCCPPGWSGSRTPRPSEYPSRAWAS